jgi:hypothetical protein
MKISKFWLKNWINISLLKLVKQKMRIYLSSNFFSYFYLLLFILISRFKKDMISIKKILKVFDIIDISEYIGKIDGINKQILPKSLLRKKKTEDANI